MEVERGLHLQYESFCRKSREAVREACDYNRPEGLLMGKRTRSAEVKAMCEPSTSEWYQRKLSAACSPFTLLQGSGCMSDGDESVDDYS